jgi:hypothetical protein
MMSSSREAGQSMRRVSRSRVPRRDGHGHTLLKSIQMPLEVGLGTLRAGANRHGLAVVRVCRRASLVDVRLATLRVDASL